MPRLIPGGRGQKVGVDGNIVHRESIDERTTRLAPRNGWVLSNTGYPSSSLGSVTCTADRLVFTEAVLLDREFRPKEVRICVDAASAGSTVRVSIYRYMARTTKMSKIPGTEIRFSGASAGRQSATLYDDIRLNDDTRYFIGTNVSTAALALTGAVAALGSLVTPTYFDMLESSSQPSSIAVSTLTKGATLAVPAVVYLSQEAAEVF